MFESFYLFLVSNSERGVAFSANLLRFLRILERDDSLRSVEAELYYVDETARSDESSLEDVTNSSIFDFLDFSFCFGTTDFSEEETH